MRNPKYTRTKAVECGCSHYSDLDNNFSHAWMCRTSERCKNERADIKSVAHAANKHTVFGSKNFDHRACKESADSECEVEESEAVEAKFSESVVS